MSTLEMVLFVCTAVLLVFLLLVLISEIRQKKHITRLRESIDEFINNGTLTDFSVMDNSFAMLQNSIADLENIIVLEKSNTRMETKKNEEFISDISHQLKTPLAGLRLYCEMENASSPSEYTCKELQLIERMENLIQNIPVAAALVLSMTVCVANPSLAAKLPFIGNIFETLGADSGYAGDFKQDAVRLVEPEAVQEDGAVDSPYVQTDNGITFTISECNYESMAMYLAVGIESEEGFSEDLRNFARYRSYEETAESEMAVSYSALYMKSTSEADFSASGMGIYEGDPAKGTSSPTGYRENSWMNIRLLALSGWI